jgi:hypothetical protein
MTSSHVLHMQKALTQMNLQIHHVISDITGVTGLRILDAILAGERRPEVLAELRHPAIKAHGDDRQGPDRPGAASTSSRSGSP